MTRSVLQFHKAHAKEECLEGISLRMERRETAKQTMPQGLRRFFARGGVVASGTCLSGTPPLATPCPE